MQEPNLVARCIESMSKATNLPITIKTRWLQRSRRL